MRATNWEFTNRALLFGLVFGVAFPLYGLDPVNATTALANWLGPMWEMNPDRLTRVLFAFAALLLSAAAMLRTWASAYLKADVVYGAHVKTQTMVADGPYRYVRNPLYFANVLMAIAIGAMMSRVGFVVAVALMLLFCYRLILREEAEFRATDSAQYRAFTHAVPRLLPSLRPRVPSAGGRANWADGWKAESWYWGFAVGLIGFAVTLDMKLFFIFLTASVALFWLLSTVMSKR